jgi:hypothetical protein
MSRKQFILPVSLIAIFSVIIAFLFPVIGPRFIMPLMMGDNPAPTDLNTMTDRLTDNSLYRVSFTTIPNPIEINDMHSWVLNVQTADGQALDNAEIGVDGGMPQHGHGLPTRPQVTEKLGNGDYRVEGLRFQMPGWWEVKFDIAADGQRDSVTFNLVLQ